MKSIERLFVWLNKKIKSHSVLGKAMQSVKRIAVHPSMRPLYLRAFVLPEIREMLQGLYGTDDIYRKYKKEALSSRTLHDPYGKCRSSDFNIILTYILVRHMKPETIVETGISTGRSSAAFLEALKANDHGTLYSIDLDPKDISRHDDTKKEGREEVYRAYTRYMPEDATCPGWLVPDDLRDRWEIILGDSNVELPQLVERIDGIDIFYHDSDHTYETMKHEIDTTWPHIRKDGLLLVDNSNSSTAYEEYVDAHKGNYNHYYRGLGVLKK